MPPTRCRSRRPARTAAFTMGELVIGLAISSLVATTTVWSLVNLTRSNSSSKQDLSRKETVDRVLDLLQDETRNATQVDVGSTLSALGGDCSTAPQLILRGETSSEDISYALVRVEPGSLDSVGPNKLVRCGLPYNADDSLDQSANRIEQVVLDALPDGAFSLTPGGKSGGSSPSNTGVNRTLGLSLNSSSGSGGRNLLQVPISTNMAYDLAAQTSTASSCATIDTTGCEYGVRGSRLFRRGLGDSSVTGLPGMEDIVYFQGISKSDIRLSGQGGNGPCNSQYCEVRSRDSTEVTIVRDVDVLIFRDAEIRL